MAAAGSGQGRRGLPPDQPRSERVRASCAGQGELQSCPGRRSGASWTAQGAVEPAGAPEAVDATADKQRLAKRLAPCSTCGRGSASAPAPLSTCSCERLLRSKSMLQSGLPEPHLGAPAPSAPLEAVCELSLLCSGKLAIQTSEGEAGWLQVATVQPSAASCRPVLVPQCAEDYHLSTIPFPSHTVQF